MSQGTSCTCTGTKAERMKNWVVVHYRCNYSAFNGSKYTPSAYSAIHCICCGARWRTKAAYVNLLSKRLSCSYE